MHYYGWNKKYVLFIIIRLVLIFTILNIIFFLGENTADAEVMCHVATHQGTALTVRKSPQGPIINRLRNGRLVRVDEEKRDSEGGRWVSVSGVYKTKYRNWGWVLYEALECVDTGKFPTEIVSVKALRDAGLMSQLSEKYEQFAVSCDIVPNGWGVSLSREIYSYYKSRGFSEDAVCLALGSAKDVNFDPETGKMLRLYGYPDDFLQLTYPFHVPDCYKTVKINGGYGGIIVWRPTNCRIRYHPTTGLRISDPNLVELAAGGAAGGGVDEDDQTSSVSDKRLKALLRGK